MGGDDFNEGPADDEKQLTFETDYTGQSPSIAVAETIATIEGVSPSETDFTMYECLDPEALDTILSDRDDSEETNIVAEFNIDDYAIQVTSTGKLTVTAPDNE